MSFYEYVQNKIDFYINKARELEEPLRQSYYDSAMLDKEVMLNMTIEDASKGCDLWQS